MLVQGTGNDICKEAAKAKNGYRVFEGKPSGGGEESKVIQMKTVREAVKCVQKFRTFLK